MLLINESSERNDANNWVKNRLIDDGKHMISFEGYTIHSNLGTALFDRRAYTDTALEDYGLTEIETLIRDEEPYLNAKLAFAQMLKVNYYYVFYRYESEKVLLYRFGGETHFSLGHNHEFIANQPRQLNKQLFQYDGFCRFMKSTMLIRDLTMSSRYMEKGLPKIDKILRADSCGIPWMGNLDGIFLTSHSKLPKALIEFQTTNYGVAKHCNNKYFAASQGRYGLNKGDEQRWKVFHNIALQSKLPLIIIVWSPKEVNGDIKLKIVSDVIYSDDAQGRPAGLIYAYREIVDYETLLTKLDELLSE